MDVKDYDTYANDVIIKKLLSLGFDWQYYHISKSLSDKWYWKIPLRIVQKWLYEVKHYSVIVNHVIGNDPKTIYSEYEIVISKMNEEFGSYGDIIFPILGGYVTYEQALSDGLDKCLNLILFEKI